MTFTREQLDALELALLEGHVAIENAGWLMALGLAESLGGQSIWVLTPVGLMVANLYRELLECRGAEPRADKELREGDIVLLDPETVGNRAFAGALMVVTEPKPWGAQGYVPGGQAYYRATWEEMIPTGGRVPETNDDPT